MVRHSTPTLRVKVSDSLRCASVHNSGSLIATGAVNGETTLINLSESLYKVCWMQFYSFFKIVLGP